MDADTKKKLLLEDVLLLRPAMVTEQSNISRLANLSEAYQNKRSDSNYKKLVTEIHISRKQWNEQITDEAMEKMIIEDLKGKSYSGFTTFFKSNYQDSLDKSMKNALKSVDARVKANALFPKKDHDVKAHEDIWELYSKSVAFAPVGSKELVLAYECRSNLLLHFKKYEDCIKDIDRALAITDFPLLITKLMCRKMSCLVNMNKDVNEKKTLWLSISDELEQINDQLKDEKFMKIIKQAESDSLVQPIQRTENMKQPVIPSKPNLDLVCNKVMHMIAKCDIVPGQEVTVTKPLITSTNPDKCYAYCSHCLSFMWAGIPCDECSLCMYCSEECKTKAWEKYHILECKVLPHINFDNVIYFDLQISIKVFLMGLREFGSIQKLMVEVDKLTDNPILGRKDELYNSDFLNFYSQPVKCSRIEFFTQCSRNACFLLAYLTETCDVFEQDVKLLKGKALSKKKDIVFCGVLLFKILLLCKINVKFVEPAYTKPTITSVDIKTLEKVMYKRGFWKGKIFDPFEMMFEKSCNPNVARFWKDNGQMVYLCVQPIKKSEKITICRSTEFFGCHRNMRDAIHSKSVEMCECDPCVKNWPIMVELYKKFEQRHLKSDKREIKIVREYLKKNDMVTDKVVEKNWKLKESELQQLAKDLNDVYNVCGQPSFASSFLITILCTSYEIMYGTVPLKSKIPKDC